MSHYNINLLLSFNFLLIMSVNLNIYPTKKKRNTTVLFSHQVLLLINANCHEILISDQIPLKLKCSVDEYLCLQCAGTKTSMQSVKGLRKPLFNDTVYAEFQVCFTIAKYEKDIFSLCKTSNPFIHAFCHSKINFHQHGPLKLIKTILKSFHVLLGLSPVWNSYQKGSHMTRATKCSIIIIHI